MALAGQAEAAENLTAARMKATALVEAAQVEGAALVAAAQSEAAQADDTYAAAWNASKDAGWNPAQLRSMGYAKPPVVRRSAPAGGLVEDRSDDHEHVANVA